MSTHFSDPHTGVSIELNAVRTLTAVHALCNVSPLSDLRVSGPIAKHELRVRLPEAGIDFVLSPLADDATEIPIPLLGRASEQLLERVTDPHETEFVVTLDGHELGRLPVTLLALDRWAHDRASRRLVAAYALPGEDRIALAVHGASTRAGRSLAELSLAGTPDTETALRALYEWMLEVMAVEYEAPRVERATTGVTFQRVLTPRAVITNLTNGVGRGNCLDLSLFLAGALETLTLQPLLIFTGSLDEAPAHVFLGCWRERADRFRPVITESEDLRRAVQQGELLVVEATGVCTGRWRQSFDQAQAAARAILQRDDVHAVDIAASRPPTGTVRPLVPGPDPIVQRALWLSEQFGDRLGAHQRETIHLLFGTAHAGGPLVTRILERSGASVEKVIALLEKALHPESADGSPRATKNYTLCLDTARSNARARGSARVEECDLLWAVIDNPSRNVTKALAAAGCDLALLRDELGRWDQVSAEVTLSRSFHARSGETQV